MQRWRSGIGKALEELAAEAGEGEVMDQTFRADGGSGGVQNISHSHAHDQGWLRCWRRRRWKRQCHGGNPCWCLKTGEALIPWALIRWTENIFNRSPPTVRRQDNDLTTIEACRDRRSRP